MSRILLLCFVIFGFSSCQSCAGANPFIPMLQANGVTIYSSPQNNSQHCGNEWATYGTCCDPSTLTTYATNAQQSLAASANSVKSLVGKINTVLTSIGNAVNPIYTRLSGNTSLYDVLTQFYNFTASINTLSAQTNETIQSCLNTMTSIRSASLCGACSGRSARYFSNGKAMVSQSDCLAVTKTCQPLWRISVTLIDAMYLVSATLTGIKAAAPLISSGLTTVFPQTNALEAYINANQLREHLRVCNYNDQGGSCPQVSAYVSCGSLITLQASPFFTNVSNILTEAYAYIQGLSAIAASLSSSAPTISTTVNTLAPKNVVLPMRWNGVAFINTTAINKVQGDIANSPVLTVDSAGQTTTTQAIASNSGSGSTSGSTSGTSGSTSGTSGSTSGTTSISGSSTPIASAIATATRSAGISLWRRRLQSNSPGSEVQICPAAFDPNAPASPLNLGQQFP